MNPWCSHQISNYVPSVRIPVALGPDNLSVPSRDGVVLQVEHNIHLCPTPADDNCVADANKNIVPSKLLSRAII